eukprot:3021697-Amphidinium_carterae.2
MSPLLTPRHQVTISPDHATSRNDKCQDQTFQQGRHQMDHQSSVNATPRFSAGAAIASGTTFNAYSPNVQVRIAFMSLPINIWDGDTSTTTQVSIPLKVKISDTSECTPSESS